MSLKDSSGNFTTISRYLLKLPGSFRIIVGYDRAFLPTMVLGDVGAVTGPDGVVPESFVKLFVTWKRRDLEEAVYLQREVTILSSILKKGGHLPTIKMNLALRGFGNGSMRQPFRELTGIEKKNCRRSWKGSLGISATP